MSKARTLANLISDNAELADGQISVAEVVGAAPTANPTFTGNIDAGDNVKIRLGDSDDLQIYHSGSTSFIRDMGDGDLQIFANDDVFIRGQSTNNYMARFAEAGAVTLYHNNASKLATTATGIDVTGTVTTSGNFLAEQPTSIDSTIRATGNNTRALSKLQAHTGGGTDINMTMGVFGDANRGEISTSTNHTLRLYVNNTPSKYLEIGTTGQIFTSHGMVINEDSHDSDFRVESNNNSHMLFVDGGTNGVGINGTPFINFAASSYGHLVFGNAYSTDGGGDIKNSGISWPSAANGNQVISSLINASQDGNYGAIIQFHTRGSGGGNLVERMRIDESQVAINEYSRSQDFRVESDSNTHALFVDASNDRVCIGHSSTGLFTASARFEVDATSNSRTAGITTKSSGLSLGLWQTGTSGDLINFAAGVSGSQVGQVTHNGTGVTYNTTSDRRLKDNIQPIANGTDKLMAMKPVTYTWIADPEAPSVHGFIAQEMQEIVPEAISGEDGGEEMMSMDYGRITPVLVAALQEATNEIKALKQRVSELEAK